MLFDLPFWPTISILMLLHCAIGLSAALLARQKGLGFQPWLVKGFIGGTVALIIVARTQSK